MPTEEIFGKYRVPTNLPGTTRPTQSQPSQQQDQTVEDDYDWEAFDYVRGIDFDTYKQCMTNLEGFQALFTDISSLPNEQKVAVGKVLMQMTANISQEEFVGRLGQIAEIVGNQNMIQCVDAIKSYEYDLQMAASDGAAANGNGSNGSQNGNGANGNGSSNGENGSNGNGDLSLWQKVKSAWYTKLILLGLVGGAGVYGYMKFIKKDKGDDLEEDEDEFELEEGEVFVPKDFGKKKKGPILEVDDSEDIDLLPGETFVPRNWGQRRGLKQNPKKKRKVRLKSRKSKK